MMIIIKDEKRKKIGNFKNNYQKKKLKIIQLNAN